MRWFLAAVSAAWLASMPVLVGPATGQESEETGAPEAGEAQALIEKLNAYTALLNRTGRARESLVRYASWVDMARGPTGRERIVYGLYSLYDVHDEIAEAVAATATAPKLPELDAAILVYVAAYQGVAPTIDRAEGYYERQDYKYDGFSEGRALHDKLGPMGKAFLSERARLEALYSAEKQKADAAELVLLERSEGRKARWQVANVMMQARKVVELLPGDERTQVDMAAFDDRLASYAAAVRAFDAFSAENRNATTAFESRPRSLLGRFRELRDTLARVRGDGRRLGQHDLVWVRNDYNIMVTTAQIATRFAR